ncbi:hypothetical protein AB0H34_13870 [Saccharopolyspora shandongensis]|uniref:hypothetical protein n=1 Tax=Saccharopolyspora shandongensis TaxID=418495 RepID=UPI0033FB2358
MGEPKEHIGPLTVDSLQQSAANETRSAKSSGEDPVELAEESVRSYPEGQWISPNGNG